MTVTSSKIFINEKLPESSYKEFLGFKLIAKKLSLKFIWHRAGRFLVRRAEGERDFNYNTAEDLETISKALNTKIRANLPSKSTDINVVTFYVRS